MFRAVVSMWIGMAIFAACSNDDSAAPNVAPADDGGPGQKPPPPDADPGEAEDAEAAAKPPPVIPACVGTFLPLVQSGERTYVSVNLGGDAAAKSGDFALDFGANSSTIDLKAFDPDRPSPSSCGGDGDAAALGTLCQFPDFDFFGPWGTVGLYTADYGFLVNSVKQAGIIGTDFLSVFPFTLDYFGKRIAKGSLTGFCTDAQLLGAGYSPISAQGFYTNAFSKLRPLSDVIADRPDATTGFVVPNVPTVPISIAGVSALAQLDTGYDDRLQRHSINVNQALLERLQAVAPNAIDRRTNKDLYLTTCVPGLSQKGTAYAVTAGTAVDFVGEGGAVARHDTGTYLFVKENLPEAERCGGIETWTVPAAQLGASFLVDAQAVVFDPIASRVWLPKL